MTFSARSKYYYCIIDAVHGAIDAQRCTDIDIVRDRET